MAWNVALVGLAEGQCTPFRKNWQPWLAGSCINLHATFLAISVPSILTDIAILALPLPHVWKLQTNKTQKVSLSIIFLLGSFVVFTSIYRFTVYIAYDPNDLPCKYFPSTHNRLALTLSRHPCPWMCMEYCRAQQWHHFSLLTNSCKSPHQRTEKHLTRLQGPLVRLAFKHIGGTSKGLSANSTPANSKLVTIGGGGGGSGHHAKQRSQNFQRLQDDQKYGDSVLNLSPEHGGKITATVTGHETGDSDNGSGDEIPLRAIRQQTDVEWREERVGRDGKTAPVQRGF